MSVMNAIGFLVRVFIDVFGITRPTERQQRAATVLISGMLIGVMLLLALLVFEVLHVARG